MKTIALALLGIVMASCGPRGGGDEADGGTATGTFCGGIAAIACPGNGTCVDDPNDSCSPDDGGADCGGICSCDLRGDCPAGSHWDSSSEVCDCVPVDDNGTTGPFCGGFAGIPCPGNGTCVDDPNDSCDPEHGGADCGGICTCEATGECDGTEWDASPDVCDCVGPETPIDACATVRCKAGTHCVVVDSGAQCQPDETTNPCAAALCEAGTTCEAVDGKAVCQPNTSGVTCGKNVCVAGEVCCNESCGICAPPDGGCIDLWCEATD